MAYQVIDRFDGEYHFLSNFHPSPFTCLGVEWKTVEHFYQACKTLDPEEVEKIRLAETPGQAKRLGKEVKKRHDWNTLKLHAMHRALTMKFAIPELRAKLLATGDAILIEGNNWGDRYWGQVDGVGQNWLGELLMGIREELRNA